MVFFRVIKHGIIISLLSKLSLEFLKKKKKVPNNMHGLIYELGFMEA